jgi:peptidoglycan hydrolase CwlO-like protein
MQPPTALVLSAILLLTTMLTVTPATAAEDKRADTRKALRTVVNRLNALDVWFSDADEQKVRWLNEVRSKDKEVASISEAVDDARVALSQVMSSLRGLEAERGELQVHQVQ